VAAAESAGLEEKDGNLVPRQSTAQGLFPFINDEPHIWKVPHIRLHPGHAAWLGVELIAGELPAIAALP
jgi:hypothetical protein